MNFDKPILFLDSECIFCNKLGQRVLRFDKKESMYISTLQGSTASKLRDSYPSFPDSFDSLIWFEDGKVYLQSSGVLRMIRHLPFPHFLPYIFIIIPPFIRNWFYDFFSKRRKKWFGETEVCLLPSPDQARAILP